MVRSPASGPRSLKHAREQARRPGTHACAATLRPGVPVAAAPVALVRPTSPHPSVPAPVFLRTFIMTVDSSDSFASRHIGPRATDVSEMLATVRASSLDALVDEV